MFVDMGTSHCLYFIGSFLTVLRTVVGIFVLSSLLLSTSRSKLGTVGGSTVSSFLFEDDVCVPGVSNELRDTVSFSELCCNVEPL